MFSSRELHHYNLPTCLYCIHRNGDVMCKKQTKQCDFEPEDWNKYIEIVVNTLKLQNVPDTKRKKLTRTVQKEPGTTAEGDFTSDTYYCQLVNDSLWLLRHKQGAYVFSLSHIKDILRYESDIIVSYMPKYNSFYITKP